MKIDISSDIQNRIKSEIEHKHFIQQAKDRVSDINAQLTALEKEKNNLEADIKTHQVALNEKQEETKKALFQIIYANTV